MTGLSSSRAAGAVRPGRIVSKRRRDKIDKINFFLKNSFAAMVAGDGTDMAPPAGRYCRARGMGRVPQ